MAAKETHRTLALSTAQYSDKNEYKDVIGAVRIYYSDDGQELFKTFAIGTQVQAVDMLAQFAAKLRIGERLEELGEKLELIYLKDGVETVMEDTSSPLAVQVCTLSHWF